MGVIKHLGGLSPKPQNFFTDVNTMSYVKVKLASIASISIGFFFVTERVIEVGESEAALSGKVARKFRGFGLRPTYTANTCLIGILFGQGKVLSVYLRANVRNTLRCARTRPKK